MAKNNQDFHLGDLNEIKERWLKNNGELPAVITVVEFYGKGDPFFGGSADDRVLRVDGRIGASGFAASPKWDFSSIEDAAAAAKNIPNRRENSFLGLIPWFSWELVG